MDEPAAIWADSATEPASFSPAPLLMPEFQLDWPPGFLEDIGPGQLLQQSGIGLPADYVEATGQLKEAAATQGNYTLGRRLDEPRPSDVSEGEQYLLRPTAPHLPLSFQLLQPPRYEQPSPGIHDPLVSFSSWPGSTHADGHDLSLPENTASAAPMDAFHGSCSNSSTGSADSTRQLGCIAVDSASETLEDARTYADCRQGAQGLRAAGISGDSPYSPSTASDSDSDTEAEKSSGDEARPRSATHMRLRRRSDAKPRCRQDIPEYRRKQHNPWLVEETRALMTGVHRCGVGRWADIKRLQLPGISKRSAVDLKDKWRNLVRLSALHGSSSRTKADKRREVPADVVLQVRKLLHEASPEPV